MTSVEVLSPIAAEAEVKKYTLVGDDIYVRRYTNGTVPEWYRSLISDIIAGDNSITDLEAAVAYISSWKPAYDITITNLQNADTLIDTRLDVLDTTSDVLTAGVGQLWSTKIDSISAQTIAYNVVDNYFNGGTADSWFNSRISTYASNITANADNVSTFTTVLGDQEVRIDNVEQVIGDAYSWSATATKLVTLPDGSITGWMFANGTNIQSSFKVQASNFSLSNGTTGYTPFSVAGSNVNFSGIVDFTATNTYGTTTLGLNRLPVITNTWRYADSSVVALTAVDTWTTFAQVTVTVVGTQTVDVSISMSSNKLANVEGMSLRVLRDTTLVYGSTDIGTANSLYASSTFAINTWVNDAIVFSESLAAGTYVYYAQFATYTSGAAWHSIRDRYVTATIFNK